MPIQLIEENGGKILVVHVSGKLVNADYAHFVPAFERLVSQHGKLRLLFDMTDFHGYAIYRIAETLRVLLLMTLTILFFNFYPMTAVMIVILALLNDGAILSIAYDNVHYKDKP